VSLCELLEHLEPLNGFRGFVSAEGRDSVQNACPALGASGSRDCFTSLAFEPIAKLFPFRREIQLVVQSGDSLAVGRGLTIDQTTVARVATGSGRSSRLFASDNREVG
jgi:hypothetical protein